MQLAVAPRSRVHCITTGREVKTELHAALAESEIYDATGPYLHARLIGWGALPTREAVGDDPDALVAAIARSDGELIVSSGAVSMGDHDFVPEVLRSLGAEVIFHRVAIRPGKPILLARLASGVPFVGLPGNPASSAAGLSFFVRPLLAALEGQPTAGPQVGSMRAPYRKGSHRLRMLARAALTFAPSGRCEVEIVAEQPSFMVSPFVRSNGWAEVAEELTELNVGDVVPVLAD